jgi:hypothetical protein
VVPAMGRSAGQEKINRAIKGKVPGEALAQPGRLVAVILQSVAGSQDEKEDSE